MSTPPDDLAAFADPTAHVRVEVGDFGPVENVSFSKAAVPQTRYARGAATAGLYQELGRTGLRHWGGFVFEEWLRELQQGRRAAEVYREMQDSDPVVGGMMYAIETLCRRVTWWTEAASSSQLDQKNAAWHDTIRDDVNHSWTDLVAEILSFLPYGWSYFEEVFKVRGGDVRDPTRKSMYDDGTIGLRKLSIRSQDSLWKWVFDDDGGIEGLIQNPPPDYALRFIPIEKALLFRTRVTKNNPEGRSVLRSAYRSWYFLKNIQNIEGIGIERDLAGLPTLQAPENVDIWNTSDPVMAAMAAQARQVVSSIRRDEQEGVLLPFGWELRLLGTGGRRQFDTTAIITRYEQRIATSVLLDVILMGQDKVGSYALAGVKKGLFTASLEAYLDQITSVWNDYAIPQLFQINGFKTDAGYPKLCHGTVESIDLETLGNYVGKLAGAGAPLFGNELEDPLLRRLLDEAGLPMPGGGAVPEDNKPPTARYRPRGASTVVPAGGGKGTTTNAGNDGSGGGGA